MSKEKHGDNDPERTLVTLEQLSQTIEVMTSVVNRLRQHLSEQLQAKVAEAQPGDGVTAELAPAEAAAEKQAPTRQDVVSAQQKQPDKKPESFVVEIRQHEPEPTGKTDKTLH